MFTSDIEELSFAGGSRLSSKWIVKAVTRCTGLMSLDLTKCFNVVDDTIGEILHGVPGLLKLNLCGCRKVGDGALRHLQERGPNIRHLNLSGCYNITREGGYLPFLRSRDRRDFGLASYVAPLESLDLSGLPLRTEDLIETARACSTLVDLGMGYMEAMAEDDFLRMLGLDPENHRADPPPDSLAARIRSLSIHWCAQLTDRALWVLAFRCPMLERLDIRGCHGFTEGMLSATLLMRRPAGLMDDIPPFSHPAAEQDFPSTRMNQGFAGLQFLCARFSNLSKRCVDAVMEARRDLKLDHDARA